jgi:hypothetical protein
LTVVITLLSLLILGGPVIRPLNAALLIGIISGTYSSIFNAAPLVFDFRKWFASKTVVATRPATTARSGETPRPASPGSPSSADRPGNGVRPNPVIPRNGEVPAPATGGEAPQTGAKPTIPPGPRPRKRRM